MGALRPVPAWWRETRFLARQRAAVAAVLALAALAALAVALGLGDVARQQAAIERMRALQAVDEAAVAAGAADAGAAAYATSHATWDPPAPLAFAALGQRDVAPYVLRVRALALEGQLHEGDAANPELAPLGRFDFAFVLVYLAPLLLIALLHDLRSGEREARRWPLLQSLPGGARLWGVRAAVRAGAVGLALLVPLLVGAALAGVPVGTTLAAAAVVLATVAFWTALAWLVARGERSSPANAATLLAAWFALVLVVPAGGHLVVNALVPVPAGATIARENREAVHGAWDLPREATLQRFVASHPQWSHATAMTRPFHWKWYFAFQQLGDEHVADHAAAYADGIARRERLAGMLGVLSPPLGLQRALHRLARTDVAAQLDYQRRIRAFHAELRAFYYPYLFEDRPFGAADAARAPRWEAVDDRTAMRTNTNDSHL